MLLKELFPEGRFNPPATELEIKTVEKKLGVKFPPQLTDLYLQSNGFREPMGNAQYLFPLVCAEGEGSCLLNSTRFWWREWNKVAPRAMRKDFKQYIFFGSSSGDDNWGISWKGEPQIIAYHHSMEDEHETVEGDIIAVYASDFAEYDELGED